jgi:hypothetical protein
MLNCADRCIRGDLLRKERSQPHPRPMQPHLRSPNRDPEVCRKLAVGQPKPIASRERKPLGAAELSDGAIYVDTYMHLLVQRLHGDLVRLELVERSFACRHAQGLPPRNRSHPRSRPLGRPALCGVAPGSQCRLLGRVLRAVVPQDRSGFGERNGAQRRPVPVQSVSE